MTKQDIHTYMHNDVKKTIETLKNIIHQKNMCALVSDYINLLKSYRYAFQSQSTQILTLCEKERSRLHTEILKKFGCKQADTREYCLNCKDFCTKLAFVLFIESKEQEICNPIILKACGD